MKKAAVILSAVVLSIAGSNYAYAKSVSAEDTNRPNDPVVKSAWSVKDKVEKAVRAKPISKLYFYEQSVIDEAVDGRSNYDRWGKLTYQAKKGFLIFNGHGLDVEREYVLQYENNGETVVVATGTANEYGDLHLKGTLSGEAWETARLGLELQTAGDGDVVLVAHTEKIKLPKEVDLTEDEEAEVE